MFQRALERCAVGEFKFRTVLMDSWYATESLMTAIDRAGKYFCCPIKSNRNIQDAREDDLSGHPIGAVINGQMGCLGTRSRRTWTGSTFEEMSKSV
ncbi:MAG: hypothetical protein U0Z75_08455 [Deinococcaceae bacterium]